METADYFNRYDYYGPLLEENPDKDVGLIVTIPSYNEPELIQALQSLREAEPPPCKTEVLILINYPDSIDDKEHHKREFQKIKNWCSMNNSRDVSFFPGLAELPFKVAGVGLARKIIMDEALRRFSLLKKEGVIICFDADCVCDPDYLKEIHSFFERNPQTPGCSIYFEHDYIANEDPDAIIQYELFLRYYIHGLRFANYPFAHHTIGSAMAVRTEAYRNNGGMNKRKAGEDFYFLHKIMPMGEFKSLTSTRVIPSGRISDRVPFGTGKAMQDWHYNQLKFWPAYDPRVFVEIKEFLSCFLLFRNPENFQSIMQKFLPELQEFLESEKFEEEIKRINENTKSESSYGKAFYQWFDGLKVLRLIHYISDKKFPKIPVEDAANQLLELINPGKHTYMSNPDLLQHYREFDKLQEY